ncbi:MAG: hypothetical protein Q7T83_03935, partial [Thermodesulfovibrionales bacterium]|nr:hypothetical protein [Thermodesulfovibrionales bacterium]
MDTALSKRMFEGRRFHLVAGLLIALATFLVYSNTFHAGFHFDDVGSILEDYTIRNLGNLPEILQGSRGIARATFAVNYAVGGLNVAGYHIVNLAIHITNGILVYFLVFLTLNKIDSLKDRAKRIAVYTALLFAVHPVQTQAVTYIVQRMEILASMFMLTGLLLFIKGSEAAKIYARVLLYGAVAVSYLLGFFSKEVAITLPALVFLYDWCFLAKGDMKKVAAKLPLYLVLIAMLAFFVTRSLPGLQEIPGGSTVGFGVQSREPITSLEVGQQAGSTGLGFQNISPKGYAFTQFNVLIYYITLLFVPVNQNLDYDFPISKGLFDIPLVKEGTVLNIPIQPPIVSLVILLAIIGFAVYLLTHHGLRITRHSHLVAFFILWFFIILSPTSGFIP